jgi:hypothetical protein
MRAFVGCLLGLALAACTQAPDQAALDTARTRAETAANLLSERLSTELRAAMASGGTVAAISVCKERAPAIAAEIEAETGVEIGRTALSVRNRANAPDAWELAMLRAFEARHARGEALGAMAAQTLERDTLRWMRPIPMGDMCSSCHGQADELSAETRQALAASYPEDRATGFMVGALRGAFTARVPLRARV